MRLMTAYWIVLVMVSLFGMAVGFICNDKTTYVVNAALFLFDLAMLLRQPGV
jgi:hypothetical protein